MPNKLVFKRDKDGIINFEISNYQIFNLNLATILELNKIGKYRKIIKSDKAILNRDIKRF